MKRQLFILILGFGTFSSTAVFAMEKDEANHYTMIFKFPEDEDEESGIPEMKTDIPEPKITTHSEDTDISLKRRVSAESAYPVSILNKIILPKVKHKDLIPLSPNMATGNGEKDSY